MINTSEHKNEDIVKSGVVDYPIGFPFYFNPDRTPQLLVKIGDEELRFNHNFELSEDKDSVVLRPTEEESWTLEGPEDFSWMTKWDGKDLLIERAVPFVQDSDYQLGRISSEQIERDFDLSVMRDQALDGKIKKLRNDMVDEFVATDSRFDSVQEQTDAKFAEVDSRIDNVQEQTNAKFAETDIAISGLAVGVAANEAAIQETREDFASADQVIRDDMNAKDSRLQTQITAQATAIAGKQDKLTAGKNITIVDNVISATGGGGGGVSGDFLPLSGGEMTGLLTLNAETKTSAAYYGAPILRLKAETEDGTTKLDHALSLTPGGILLANDLDIYGLGDLKPKDEWKGLGDPLTPWGTVYAKKLHNGATLNIPTEGGTLARLEDLEGLGGASLPDQTGNAGKFLKTDGTTASWGEALVNNNTTLYDDSLAIGKVASVPAYSFGLAIGSKTEVVPAGATHGGLALGYGARTYKGAVMLNGSANMLTNDEVGTFKVATNGAAITIMDANGNVPLERLTYVTDMLENIDALPDQSGNAGKVLTTDGSTASWQEPQGGGTKIIIKRYN